MGILASSANCLQSFSCPDSAEKLKIIPVHNNSAGPGTHHHFGQFLTHSVQSIWDSASTTTSLHEILSCLCYGEVLVPITPHPPNEFKVAPRLLEVLWELLTLRGMDDPTSLCSPKTCPGAEQLLGLPPALARLFF